MTQLPCPRRRLFRRVPRLSRPPLPPRMSRLALLALPLMLAACGGGGGGGDSTPPAAAECSTAAQTSWLRSYFNDWYFWYRLSPNPDPAGFASPGAYFDALLYTGSDGSFPRDRWSFTQSTESFSRFFGDGKSMGYGVSVAGLEVTGRPDLPLYVRYVEPQSDAAAKGVQRGDQVLSLNGRAVADIIAANDFSALTAGREGDSLVLRLRNGGGVERSVTLTASVYGLTSVTNVSVQTTPGGRRVGYLQVKEMVSQVSAPLAAAFAQFKDAGVQDLVLDLRYNGGGLVQVAGELASYLGGDRARGQTFATLLYNDRRANQNNERFAFAAPAAALSLNRVYVLAGERTCSASEQVVNGLRPFVEVVLVGDTTCGKPVGFLPVGQCGTTYNVVNFESVNARNEGRYFDGFNPTCPVAEDFTRPLGASDEPLLAAARRHADTGSCRVAAVGPEQPQSRRPTAPRAREPGEWQGMLAR